MKKILVIITIILISVSFLSADIYIKTKTHTGEMNFMGKKTPAKDVISEQWLGDRIYTNISTKQIIIIDLNKKVVYMINPSNKTYVETALPLDMKKLLPERAAAMMSMMKLSIKVTPTSETKIIKGWKCKGYNMDMNMTMMTMKSKLWVTQDVPFNWKKFQDEMGLETFKAAMASMNIGDEALKEFKKIKGFQVASTLTMSIMGQNVVTTSEVQEISKKTPPAGIYKIPSGYTKVNKINFKGMGR